MISGQANRRAVRCFAGMSILLWIAAPVAAAAPNGPAERSLDWCQSAVRTEGIRFLQAAHRAIATCLGKVSSEVVKKNAARSARSSSAAPSSV